MAKDIDYSIHYRRWHKDSVEHFEMVANTYGRLLNSLINSIPSSAKILDYGCGSGLLTYFLGSSRIRVDVGQVGGSSQKSSDLEHYNLMIL